MTSSKLHNPTVRKPAPHEVIMKAGRPGHTIREFNDARNLAGITTDVTLQMIAAVSPERAIRYAVVHNLNVDKSVLGYLRVQTEKEGDAAMLGYIVAAEKLSEIGGRYPIELIAAATASASAKAPVALRVEAAQAEPQANIQE